MAAPRTDRDFERFGTRGHVDIVAAITSPGRVILHTQGDESHPDYQVSREIRAALEASRDAAGRAWEIIEMPAPATLTDDEGFVDYSYINHLVVNGGVIACGFDDVHDTSAAAILAEEYPGRKVVTVDARPLFERGRRHPLHHPAAAGSASVGTPSGSTRTPLSC